MALADTVTNTLLTALPGALAASLPGVLVALVAYYLQIRHEARLTRQLNTNARALLGIEIASNVAALREFWQTINNLDKEQQTETEAHLAAMAAAGLLSYALPHWSFTHWDRFPPEALGALSGKEAHEVDHVYRDLRSITDMYTKLITIPPDELELLNKDGRFWMNRFAGDRVNLFERLRDATQRALDARPLP